MTGATTGLVADALIGSVGALITIGIIVLYRAVRGPTIQDRVIAVNVAGTNTVVIIAVLAAVFGDPGLLDIAIVYALLNFTMSIAIAHFSNPEGGYAWDSSST